MLYRLMGCLLSRIERKRYKVLKNLDPERIVYLGKKQVVGVEYHTFTIKDSRLGVYVYGDWESIVICENSCLSLEGFCCCEDNDRKSIDDAKPWFFGSDKKIERAVISIFKKAYDKVSKE